MFLRIGLIQIRISVERAHRLARHEHQPHDVRPQVDPSQYWNESRAQAIRHLYGLPQGR